MSAVQKSTAGPPLYGMPLAFAFLSPDDERTFQYDDSLPSLPIPPLPQTLSKYLESVKPYLSKEEYQKTQKIVEEFGRGIGHDLHCQLLEFAKHKQNWLEKWWEDYAYLTYRIPHAPFINFAGPTPYSLDAWPPLDGTQVERAALVTWYMLQFWSMLRKEKLRVDRGGKTTVWSMHQFTRMFSGCKTPGETMDKLNHYFKTEREGPMPTHLLVICRSRFFTFDALDSDGHVITAPEIEMQLRHVRSLCDGKPPGPGVGALTAENHTTWWELRNHLISLSPINEQNLECIEKSLFGVVLDDLTPVTLNEISREALVGDARNRWFDKSVSAITFKNGMMVSNCDHAPHDAMVNVVISYFNYIGLEECGYKWQGPKATRVLPLPVELVFQVDTRILKAIDDAAALHKKGGDGMDIHTEPFTNYGKEAIRKLKLHPDAYIQMALQYGYYRLYKKPAATYETASTRKFYHGRTETLRSCTMESLEWTRSMLDTAVSNKKRVELLRAAIDKHLKLMGEAQENQGCDRHLFGMQVVALSQGQSVPELYTDKAYTLSGGGGNYILSTSCVGYTPVYGGVAPMCKDGYGFFYSIEPDRINFFSASWVEDKDTCPVKLIHSVFEALVDMKQLVENTVGSQL
jgi:carnitine O-octanoyltransferase